MGNLNFSPGNLADYLSEAAGYKAGIALSLEELCDHFGGTPYADVLRRSEQYGARLRSEEFEQIFYRLLYRIGYTKEEYDGDYTGARRIHKYRRLGLEAQYLGMSSIFGKLWPALITQAKDAGAKSIDPRPFVEACTQEYGVVGLELAIEQLEILNHAHAMNPYSIFRAAEWKSLLELRSLFSGSSKEPEAGRFIDQRFVNYLSNNEGRLGEIHWRKFEELTAEFFGREGFRVQLGPGSNDDGVDVRVWRPEASPTDAPLCLVQCKRQKQKVGRVVVKGLFADVSHEGSEFGVVVTTSELSPGAKATIAARGYPIADVDRSGITKWLERLRTPGTGIVRL